MDGRDASTSEIRALTDRVDSRVFGSLDCLTDADRTQEGVYHFPGENAPPEERFPIEDLLSHAVEEELPHRGELNALPWPIYVEHRIAGRDGWKRLAGDENNSPAVPRRGPPASRGSGSAYQRFERGRECPPRPPESEARPSPRRSRRPEGGLRPRRPWNRSRPCEPCPRPWAAGAEGGGAAE